VTKPGYSIYFSFFFCSALFEQLDDENHQLPGIKKITKVFEVNLRQEKEDFLLNHLPFFVNLRLLLISFSTCFGNRGWTLWH